MTHRYKSSWPFKLEVNLIHIIELHVLYGLSLVLYSFSDDKMLIRVVVTILCTLPILCKGSQKYPFFAKRNFYRKYYSTTPTVIINRRWGSKAFLLSPFKVSKSRS